MKVENIQRVTLEYPEDESLIEGFEKNENYHKVYDNRFNILDKYSSETVVFEKSEIVEPDIPPMDNITVIKPESKAVLLGLHWINDIDSYICPICKYSVKSNKETCPRCGFVDDTIIQ